MRTKHIYMRSEAQVAALVLRLVKLSQWFSLEPLPDDNWRLSVKEEVSLDLLLPRLGHVWDTQDICCNCETKASEALVGDRLMVCPCAAVAFPLEAIVIGDNRGNVHGVALVGRDESTHEAKEKAEYFDHGFTSVTPDYCRAGTDLTRLLYEMNDQPEPHIRIEYDKNYRGGDYAGVGEYHYISAIDVDPQDDAEVHAAFETQTGLPASCIVHYSEDEMFTQEGEPLEL